MDGELIKIAATQGIWATVAVSLIFYILKSQEKRDIKQDERERNYQDIIKKLTNQLYIIKELQEDIEEIKESVVPKQ